MDVKKTLTNLNWEKGFQRLWLIYACLLLCRAFIYQAAEAESFDESYGREWLAAFIKVDFVEATYLLFWLFAPVLLSKAFQWVLKGFKTDNK
jgi:hypothetical protein